MAGELGLGFKKVLCKLEGSKESVGFTVSLSHSISDRKQIVWQFIRSLWEVLRRPLVDIEQAFLDLRESILTAAPRIEQ